MNMSKFIKFVTTGIIFLCIGNWTVFGDDPVTFDASMQVSENVLVYKLLAKSVKGDIQRARLKYWISNYNDPEYIQERVFEFDKPEPAVDITFKVPLEIGPADNTVRAYFYQWLIEDTEEKIIESNILHTVYTGKPDLFTWYVMETDHFVFYFYDKKTYVQEELFPFAEKSYSSISSDMKFKFPNKISVYCFNSKSDYRKAGISASSNQQSIFIYDLDNKAAIAYDFADIILNTKYNVSEIPLWLYKGLLKYEQAKVLPHLGERALLRIRKRYIDESLGSLHDIENTYTVQDNVLQQSLHDQGYTLVKFLLSQYGWDRMHLLLDELNIADEIEDVDVALMLVYGKDFSMLEEEWNNDIMKRYIVLNSEYLKNENNLSVDEVKIRDMLKKFSSAWKRKDANALGEFLTEDFRRVLARENDVFLDKAKYIEFTSSLFSKLKECSMELSAGRLYLHTRSASIELIVKTEGTYMEDALAFYSADYNTIVFQKSDSNWYISRIIGFTDKPIFLTEITLPEEQPFPGSSISVDGLFIDLGDNMPVEGITMTDSFQVKQSTSAFDGPIEENYVVLNSTGTYLGAVEKGAKFNFTINIDEDAELVQHKLVITLRDELDNFDQKSVNYTVEEFFEEEDEEYIEEEFEDLEYFNEE